MKDLEERSILLVDTKPTKPDVTFAPIRIDDVVNPLIAQTKSVVKEETPTPEDTPYHETEDAGTGSILILDRKDYADNRYVTSVENTQKDSLNTNRSKKTVPKSIVDIYNTGTTEIISCSVHLEDWGLRLQNSPCFCKECGILFATSNSLLAHNATAHSIPFETNIANKNVCSYCNIVFRNRIVLLSHKHHCPEKKNVKGKSKNEIPNVQPQTIPIPKEDVPQPTPKTKKVLVAKSVLFKCSNSKCCLYFVDCATANHHAKSCRRRVEGDWMCFKCDKFFTSADQQYHFLQHRVSSKPFIIYLTGDDTLGRILKKCPDCETFLHDDFFTNHCISPCIKDAVMCGFCKLEIHSSSIEEHYAWHVKLNLSDLEDFIIVEFEKSEYQSTTEYQSTSDEATSDAKKRKNDDINEDVEAKKKKKDDDTKLIKVYYCTKCTACSIGYRRLMHTQSKCLTSTSRCLKLCNICGLAHFYANTHKMFHDKNPKLTIMDMKFIREDTGEVIAPPSPRFPQCNNCGVQYLMNGKSKHYCSNPYKSCDQCKALFNDTAFNLHLKFHEYASEMTLSSTAKIPSLSQRLQQKILKNTKKNTPNPTFNNKKPSTITQPVDSISQDLRSVLYRCDNCDIVFGSYDKSVEHCQKHINLMESLGVIIKRCEICSLKFDGACFDRHAELHAQNENIKKDFFKIINYKYTDLLSAHWLYFLMQQSNLIEQITARSIYLHTRKVKMRVVKDGAPDATLFKCCKCEKYVHPTAVYIHSRSDACVRNSRNYPCRICKIPFTTITGMSQHENLHNTFDSFKIVHFNEEGDDYFNEALCRYESEAMFKESNDAKLPTACKEKKIKLYRCNCGLHFTSKSTVEKHVEVCNPELDVKEKCKCGRLFNTAELEIHKRDHIRCDNTILLNTALVKSSYIIETLRVMPLHIKYRHKSQHYENTMMTRPIEIVPSEAKPKFNITKKSLEKIHLRKYSNTLYKCEVCETHFLQQCTLESHLQARNHYNFPTDNCDICNFLFTSRSLCRHKYIHHDKMKLQRKDFNIITSKLPHAELGNDALTSTSGSIVDPQV